MAREERFQFIGHYSCLDFVNTESTKEGARRIDILSGFSDLIAWLRESRLMNRKQLRRALKSWGSGHDAERIFQSALRLREAIRSMAEKLATRQSLTRTSLEVINRTIGKRPGCVLLARRSGRFEEMTRLDLK